MPYKPTKPNRIYLIYKYKEDLALNNLLWWICHKTQPAISDCLWNPTHVDRLGKNLHSSVLWVNWMPSRGLTVRRKPYMTVGLIQKIQCSRYLFIRMTTIFALEEKHFFFNNFSHLFLYIHLPNPSAFAWCDTRSFLSRTFTSFEF